MLIVTPATFVADEDLAHDAGAPGLLTCQQLDELKQTFAFFCEPSTERITAASLQLALERTGTPISAARCAAVVAEWSDTGSLGLAEFLSLFALAHRTRHAEHELRAAFAVLDADGDGLVAVDALIAAFGALEPQLTRAQATDLVMRAFPDEAASNFRAFVQEGRVSYSEFARMMTQ